MLITDVKIAHITLVTIANTANFFLSKIQRLHTENREKKCEKKAIETIILNLVIIFIG